MGSPAATAAGRRRARARSHGANGGRSGKRTGTGKGAGARRGARTSAPRRRPTAGGRSTWRRWIGVCAAVVATLAAGYFLWLRDSSILAVSEVSVEGVDSGDRQRITAALTRAGLEMTILEIDQQRLDSIAARFPTVESVSASRSLPRGLQIEVTERPPVLAARSRGEEVAVAAGGMLLPGIEAGDDLPRLDLDHLPASGRLQGRALAQALALGAAPDPLRPLIRRAEHSRELGVTVRLRGGIVLRFGSGANAEAKWAAAAAILADPQLESAAYVDVRAPERAAVGG